MMRPVFMALGLTTGVVEQVTRPADRRQAYACDVTYSTAKEIGFDFLRDRLQSRRLSDRADGVFSGGSRDRDLFVQRDLHFMLVDEADSILIDEARTPLVISSLPDDMLQRQALYEWASGGVAQLLQDQHYQNDDESGAPVLTVAGRVAARKLQKPATIAGASLTEIYDQLELALLVQEKYVRDRHYMVRDGEVVIVDEFTGRMAQGRKWRAGLHQAIEARERLQITAETSEAARITIQDLFLKYHQLCGMTGTVANSGRELQSIYGTSIAHIPTNRPPRRRALPDLVFGTDEVKYEAIVREVKELHQTGRPILIGTRSIDKSERISELLRQAGVEHQVLNARHLASEAERVACAGQLGQVTVATNMAGRGTDIQLSESAREQGGLHVIISELHESQRIDRQLIGRCGRQGDPGSYRFFMSLEDDILTTGLGRRWAKRLQSLGQQRQRPRAQLARVFRQAQSRVETRHFQGRKQLLAQERIRQTAQRELGQDPYVDAIF